MQPRGEFTFDPRTVDRVLKDSVPVLLGNAARALLLGFIRSRCDALFSRRAPVNPNADSMTREGTPRSQQLWLLAVASFRTLSLFLCGTGSDGLARNQCVRLRTLGYSVWRIHTEVRCAYGRIAGNGNPRFCQSTYELRRSLPIGIALPSS
jgi:hypothetical protein